MSKMSPYESEELTDSIFLILLTTLEPVHGYGIMQRINEMTSGESSIGPATMYTTLKKMKSAGWIEEIFQEDSKILYRITSKGEDILTRDYRRRVTILNLAQNILGGKET